MRIMVVEDDRDISSAVVDMLEAHGCNVTTAASGVDALATLKAATEPPDAILLDLWLPVMRGTDFLVAKAKLLPPRRDIPVVIFTADPSVVVTSLSAYPDVRGFVQKPADTDVIMKELEKATGFRGEAQA